MGQKRCMHKQTADLRIWSNVKREAKSYDISILGLSLSVSANEIFPIVSHVNAAE